MTPTEQEQKRQLDEEIRQEIIAGTDRSMLVEAAAGTGKTTLLVDRILSGVRRGHFGLPGVVAITFTEKAAAELESRLRQALRSMAAQKEGEERRRLEAGLEELDRANISTIHSFCATLLRERPAEAGVDPEFEVLDATQTDLLQEKCWERWIGEQVQHPEVTPLVEALIAGVKVGSGGFRSIGLQDLAGQIVGASDVLSRPEFDLGRPACTPQTTAARLRKKAEEAAAYIRTSMKGGNKNSRRLRRAVERIQDLPPDEMPLLRAAAASVARVKPEKAITSFERDSREEGLEIFCELIDVATDLLGHLACDVLEWLTGYAGRFHEEKRRRSALTFQDLLRLAARMLRDSPEARRHFQARYDAFFVDEFQDTDPLQAEVIAYLCEKPTDSPARSFREVELDQSKLFVVGDPKQSIYRFRRADVQIYEEFKDLFRQLPRPDESVRQVFRNFRSTAPLIENVNRLFDALLQPSPEPGVYQAENVRLVAAQDAPAGEAAPVVVLTPPEEEACDEWGAPEAREAEARYVAAFIRRAVEGPLPEPVGSAADRPLTYSSFACLFRALTSVDLYEEALEAQGIPYRVIGGKSFYRREEISETLALLQAVDDPLDHISIVAALRSSFFGHSDEDLLAYRQEGGRWNYQRTPVTEGPVGQTMQMLGEWHEKRNRVPPQELLRQILDRTKALEAFMLKPAGRQRAANLRKLLGQLRSFWRTARESFRSTVDYLAGLHRRQEAEEESSVVEPGDDFVSIMSIHKSKGLEFDAVVLPDLARGFLPPSGGLLVDRTGGRVAVSPAGGIQSAHYEELLQTEEGNELEEQKRLLYVAATRAKRLLALPLFWQGKRSKSSSMLGFLRQTDLFPSPEQVPFGEAQEGIFYWDTSALRAEVATAGGPRPALPEGAEPTAEDLLAARKEWLEGHEAGVALARRGVHIVRPSMLEEVKGGGITPAGVEVEGPGGRAFGSLFHAVMERLPLPETETGDLEQVAGGLARLEAAGYGAEAAAVTEAARLAVQTARNDAFGGMLAESQQVRREVPFAVPLRLIREADAAGDGFLEGSIDLLFDDGAATRILDYKTDRLYDTDPAEAADRYWPQLALYGRAAEVCGYADGPVELIVYFVRPGVLCRRALDEDLLEEVRADLARAFAPSLQPD